MRAIAFVCAFVMLVACGDGEDDDGSSEAAQTACTEAGARRCVEADRQICGADGQWAVIETCASAEACDPSHCE
jgi:hypothetical protein